MIALRVIAEVRATFGVDLSAHTVLTAPTVAELAQVIDELRLSTVDLSLIAQLVREIQQSPQVNPTSAGSVPGATLA